MVGMSSSSPADSAAFGQRAHATGANALVTTSPFYFLHSQAELPNYFRYLKQRLDLPLASYDVPSAVKVKLSASTVRELAEEGLVIGIKDSSGDLAGFREMVIATEHLPDFRAFTGSEHYVDAALLVGGRRRRASFRQRHPRCVRGHLRRRDIRRLGAREPTPETRDRRAADDLHRSASGGSFSASAVSSSKSHCASWALCAPPRSARRCDRCRPTKKSVFAR